MRLVPVATGQVTMAVALPPVQELCQLCCGLRDKQSVPHRLSLLVRAGALVDTLLGDRMAIERCRAQEGKTLHVARNHVEDFRIRHHLSASATSLVQSEGVTEDVCYFLVVCACDYLMGESATGGGSTLPDPRLHRMCCVASPWSNISGMGGNEIDCSYSAFFIYEHMVDWGDRLVHAYISALQRRVSVLLVEHALGVATLDRFAERRAQWSCATARLKVKALLVREAYHMAPEQQSEDVLSAFINTESDEEPQFAIAQATPAGGIPIKCFWQWALETIKGWDGPRLREAVARGYKRRTLRPDEVGKNVAWVGQCTISRARGAMDATEEVLHLLDLTAVATIEDEHAHGTVRTLRDVILMKLIDNALSPKGVSFLGQHLMLDSAREQWLVKSAPPTVVHVLEIAGKFTTRGHQTQTGAVVAPGNRTNELVSFPFAFLRWYALFFAGKDPIGIMQH